MLETAPVTGDSLVLLERLFAADSSASACWCMWFVIRVKDFHAGAGEVNAARFRALAESSEAPMGVIATLDGRPAGWAAAGPRSRYVRAVRTPTLKSVDQAENDRVWLVPCFFVHPDMRGQGITRRLLEAAVRLAGDSGAVAIEGFPVSGPKRGADQQVATESLFAACGFAPVARPSSNRVVMRLDLPARHEGPADRLNTDG